MNQNPPFKLIKKLIYINTTAQKIMKILNNADVGQNPNPIQLLSH